MEQPDNNAKPSSGAKTTSGTDKTTKDPLNREDKKSWRKHDNAIVRFFAKTGFTVWIIVMAIGLGLAFFVGIAAL